MRALVLRCLENVISMDGKLEGRERGNRLLLFTTFSFVLFITGVMSMTEQWPISYVANGLLITGNVGGLLMCFCRVRITDSMVRVYIAVLGVCAIIADLNTHAIGSAPMWAITVLLADLSLVLRLGRSFATGIIALAVLWVGISTVESVVRFGMFELPGSAPQWYRWERFSQLVDCATPPCPVSPVKGVFEMGISLLVMLIDFLATRGFAEAAEAEQAAMERTIQTVGDIAQLLAEYDVDNVSEMLKDAEETAGRLPPAMQEALRRLEQNLRAYRPYLPEALFEQLHVGETSVTRVQAPGTVSKTAAIAFTDVCSSTSIWESVPEAMKKAMQTHNLVVRKVCGLLGGYEVKTIGDAFMVAFEEAREAVDFGMMVQHRLLKADWPLLSMCPTTELWGGLTVRIGVNHGPVTLETNVLTGRVDYFGHTVNVAARLEGVCAPGAVAVPADLWDRVCDMCQPAVAGPESKIKLKGVSGEALVRHVWPESLSGRQYTPLNPTPVARGSSSADTAVRVSLFAKKAIDMHDVDATLGALRLAVISNNTAALRISHSLEGVVPLLQQSRATLVTLLGEYVFIGWNLSQTMPVHAESAVQFAQRVVRAPWSAGMRLGLASGKVHHGDVGTNTQRFVTVAGPTVAASMQGLRIATDMDLAVTYTTDAPMPVAAIQRSLVEVSQMVEVSHPFRPVVMYKLVDEPAFAAVSPRL